MNAMNKWFYTRKRARIEQELEESGLYIKDEDKFHLHMKKISKTDMIYTVIFIILIFAVIYKWIVGG